MKKTFKSEYEQLLYYDNSRDDNYLQKFYQTISDAIRDNLIGYFDLGALENDFNEDINFFLTKKKFDNLWTISGHILTYDENGFHLGDHVFETLKDVSKALKNKAFL